ncbi:MAG: hypothetical protein V4760_01185 [Bdellovibrionota bacterium]
MKVLLSALLLFTSASASAATCPSVDETIADFQVGTLTSSEVAEVIVCNLEQNKMTQNLCNTHVGALTDMLRSVKEEAAVGLKTADDVARAEQVVARASTCPK